MKKVLFAMLCLLLLASTTHVSAQGVNIELRPEENNFETTAGNLTLLMVIGDVHPTLVLWDKNQEDLVYVLSFEGIFEWNDTDGDNVIDTGEIASELFFPLVNSKLSWNLTNLEQVNQTRGEKRVHFMFSTVYLGDENETSPLANSTISLEVVASCENYTVYFLPPKLLPRIELTPTELTINVTIKRWDWLTNYSKLGMMVVFTALNVSELQKSGLSLKSLLLKDFEELGLDVSVEQLARMYPFLVMEHIAMEEAYIYQENSILSTIDVSLNETKPEGPVLRPLNYSSSEISNAVVLHPFNGTDELAGFVAIAPRHVLKARSETGITGISYVPCSGFLRLYIGLSREVDISQYFWMGIDPSKIWIKKAPPTSPAPEVEPPFSVPIDEVGYTALAGILAVSILFSAVTATLSYRAEKRSVTKGKPRKRRPKKRK